MTTWINTGALVSGQRPKTKAALRKALAETPELVTFDSTATQGARAGDLITATAGDIGESKLSVCGPDPYSNRKWYATVAIGQRTGRITLT